MTDEMIILARANAVRAGAQNVEFLRANRGPAAAGRVGGRGDIHCVINLSTDKP